MIPPEKGTGLETTKDVEDTDPFESGALLMVSTLTEGEARAVELEGAGAGAEAGARVGRGGSLLFSVKSLITYSLNPPT